MIRSIAGTITHTTAQTIVVETMSGVGYLVFTPSINIGEIGTTTLLHTHLAVRETALDLYGFPHYAELECFELLLTIPKIGPKSALQIMEQASLSLLIECISANDASRLSKLSGIGKKTAEKIVAELANKIPEHLGATFTPNVSEYYQDAFDTLITLGYAPGEVRSVLDSMNTTTSTSEIVRAALQQLS